MGAYVLNFNGRVTMASVKNFQLVDPEDQENVLLQFGRVGKDVFNMDYQWPLSPLQVRARRTPRRGHLAPLTCVTVPPLARLAGVCDLPEQLRLQDCLRVALAVSSSS